MPLADRPFTAPSAFSGITQRMTSAEIQCFAEAWDQSADTARSCRSDNVSYTMFLGLEESPDAMLYLIAITVES